MNARVMFQFLVLRAARMSVLVAACVVTAHSVEAKAEAPRVVVVKAATLHIGNGEAIAGGMLLIRGDRIVGVGRDLVVPPGATVIEL